MNMIRNNGEDKRQARAVSKMTTTAIAALLIVTAVFGLGFLRPSSAVQSNLYIVQAGDTLYSIGLKFGVPWQSIAQVNNIQSPYIIYAGEVLGIPRGAVQYTVQAGDTLYGIGQRFGVSWQAIASANNIQSPYIILPGEVLTIPTGTGTTYTVQAGDYLYSIGLKFGVPWQDIASANGITPPYTVYPGEVLIIPSPSRVVATITNIDPQNYPAEYLSYDLISQPNLWAFGIGDATSTIVYTQSDTTSGRNAPPQTVVDPNTGYGLVYGTSTGQPFLGAVNYITIYSPDGSFVANVTIPSSIASYVRGATFDPQNEYLYVGYQASLSSGPDNIAIFDTKTNTEVGQMNQQYSGFFGLTYYNGYIYNLIFPACCNEPFILEQISTTTNAVVNTLSGVYTNTVPVVNPLNDELYIIGVNNVTVTDLTLHQISTIPVTMAFGSIAYDPNTLQFYVSGGYAPNNIVTVISAQTNEVVQTLQVGSQPMSIVFNPKTSMIYVLNVNDQSISVIQP